LCFCRIVCCLCSQCLCKLNEDIFFGKIIFIYLLIIGALFEVIVVLSYPKHITGYLCGECGEASSETSSTEEV
jgi:hypothetical protein